MSALHIHDMERWIRQAEIVAAMSIEALLGNLKPYNTTLHELRGFSGAITSARNIMKVLEGSDLATGKMKTKVQDAYSMRSTPQVIGAARDAIAYARSQVEIELNGVGDNPIFVPEQRLTLTGANFQGSPVALPMDMAGAAITMVCVLSERRLNRLTNPALSAGAAGLPGPRARVLLGPDAQPVHGRPPDRRAADAVGAGVASSRSRRRPTRRISSRWG